MLGHNFYHQTIKKYITVFGVLFSNIWIDRTTTAGEIIGTQKVVLTYAPKDKMVARLVQDPIIEKLGQVNLPIMSWEYLGPVYDGDRKHNKINKLVVAGDDANHMKLNYVGVPYNFPFLLHIYAKYAEDATKIVEQIYPFFKPDYTVTAHILPTMGHPLDIPIVLNSTGIQDNYAGAMLEHRGIIWTLSFTLKGYLYGPIEDKPIIKFVNTRTFIGNTSLDTTPVLTTNTMPGLLANGSPTSNIELTIDINEINFDDDYGYIYIANTGPFAN